MTEAHDTSALTEDLDTAPVEAPIASAAAFADAEAREILNLLGDSDAGGSCCGGSCCAA